MRILFTLLLTISGNLVAQVLPSDIDIIHLDSFPGAKSCIIKQAIYNPKDSTQVMSYARERYTFLSDGRRIGSFKLNNCNVNSCGDSTFDSIVYGKNGLMVQKIKSGYFYGPPKENQVEVFEYDAQKRLKKKTTTADSKGWLSTQAYYYDNKGRISMMCDTDKYDTVMLKYFYADVPRMKVMIAEGRVLGVIDTTYYNQNDDVIKNALYITGRRDGVLEQRCWDSTTYEYKGRALLRKSEFDVVSESAVIYEYDKNGRITTIRKHDPNLLGEDETVEHITYDKNGNVIEHRTTELGIERVEKWAITYNVHGFPAHVIYWSRVDKNPQLKIEYDYVYTWY